MHEQILPSGSFHSHRCEFLCITSIWSGFCTEQYNSTSHCMPSQCCDLGYHQSISKVFRFYLSSRQWGQQNLSSGLQQLDTTVSELNQNQDRDALMQANISAFCLPLRFQYQPYEGDQVLRDKMSMCISVKMCSCLYVSSSRWLRCLQSARWWASWWLASSSCSLGCLLSPWMLRRYTNPTESHILLLCM